MVVKILSKLARMIKKVCWSKNERGKVTAQTLEGIRKILSSMSESQKNQLVAATGSRLTDDQLVQFTKSVSNK